MILFKNMKTKKIKDNFEYILVLLLLLFSFGFTLYQNLTVQHWKHYGLLAQSFLQGRTDIQEKPEKLLDTVPGTDGRYYFFNDPLPAVFMMPFVAIGGARVSQGYLSFIITLISAFFVWRILSIIGRENKKLSFINRLWLLLAFFFASNMVSVIYSPHPWFLAQNIGIMWVLFLIYEWLSKKRLIVLFILMFLLTLTKKNMVLPIFIYFCIDSLFFKEKFLQKTLRIGIVVLALILGSFTLFNYQRIGLSNDTLLNFYNNAHVEQEVLDKVQKYGFWSIAHFPTNFVNYFLAGPVIVRENPNDFHSHLSPPYLYPPFQGISIFFLSPIFLALIFLPLPGVRKTLPILGAFLTWAVMYLTYHASGAAQFGSRYGAEVIPFLFLLLCYALPDNFSKRAKAVIVFSVFLNMFLFRSLMSFYMNP